MYIAFDQIKNCLAKLGIFHPFFGITFLVCKQGKLPVGRSKGFPINKKEEEFLNSHYKPDVGSKYYFQPFRTSSRAGRWLSPKYPYSGSQSTRTRGDIAAAFMHKKNTDQWGWSQHYVRILQQKLERDKSPKVPTFWLAAWLFREKDWPADVTPADLVEGFFSTFHITEEERHQLFDMSMPDPSSEAVFAEAPYTDAQLLRTLPSPPDVLPEEGGILKQLQLRAVGPCKVLTFLPAERLSVVTGDNGLGKTFLLECAWWSLTGQWTEKPAYPRLDAERGEPSITFQISGKGRFSEKTTLKYEWEKQRWPAPKGRPTIPGLIVFARVDGSFAIWDPLRHERDMTSETQGLLLFSREQVLRGLEGRIEGLLRDWVRWQHAPDKTVFETFKQVLKRLSPPDMPLEPGDPVRLPHEPREIATLVHPYDRTVPFINESAGIRRIVTIGYLLVWAWNEHRVQAALAKRAPQEKMVILIDEMEAHLHPKWQRVVVPALLDVTAILSRAVEPQIMIATHSPLVLASLETTFDRDTDKLFHLQLTSSGEVAFNETPFVRHGRIDAWLTSDIFELKQPRSREGELAVEHAKRILEQDKPSNTVIRSVTDSLKQTLAPDDDFWPRWAYFAEKKGVKP